MARGLSGGWAASVIGRQRDADNHAWLPQRPKEMLAIMGIHQGREC